MKQKRKKLGKRLQKILKNTKQVLARKHYLQRNRYGLQEVRRKREIIIAISTERKPKDNQKRTIQMEATKLDR